jgi:threonyl-tRNA synthetase
MYFTKVEDAEYGIKPMNCLAHMLIYKSQIRSYRDLPLRYFELGTVHRHEKSGELHGLLRVRGFHAG